MFESGHDFRACGKLAFLKGTAFRPYINVLYEFGFSR